MTILTPQEIEDKISADTELTELFQEAAAAVYRPLRIIPNLIFHFRSAVENFKNPPPKPDTAAIDVMLKRTIEEYSAGRLPLSLSEEEKRQAAEKHKRFQEAFEGLGKKIALARVQQGLEKAPNKPFETVARRELNRLLRRHVPGSR